MSRNIVVSAVAGQRFDTVADPLSDGAIGEVTGFLDSVLADVLPDRPDLIVLSELCDLPYAATKDWRLAIDHARAREGQVEVHVGETARRHRTNIAYPSLVVEGESIYNAVTLFDRDGLVRGRYFKNYLLEVERDEAGLTYGQRAQIVELDFGTVAPVICFDLNFQDLRMQYARQRPDLILFSSAFHGSFLQSQWAFECRSYLISAIKRPADSAVLSPLGDRLASTTNYTHAVSKMINLDRVLVHLDHNVEKLKAIKQAYGRGVTVHDPGFLGAVMIASDVPGRTATDLAAEFELELLDDYLDRSVRCRPPG